jgi:DNA excision repair protein ERCC-2
MNSVQDIEMTGPNMDKLCVYYEGFYKTFETVMLEKGIFTLDDLKEFGRKYKVCPYYLARHYLTRANVIVYNYAYLLDPKIANLVSSELGGDSIIVFDECHNIDNACIEGLSLNINRKTL